MIRRGGRLLGDKLSGKCPQTTLHNVTLLPFGESGIAASQFQVSGRYIFLSTNSPLGVGTQGTMELELVQVRVNRVGTGLM